MLTLLLNLITLILTIFTDVSPFFLIEYGNVCDINITELPYCEENDSDSDFTEPYAYKDKLIAIELSNLLGKKVTVSRFANFVANSSVTPNLKEFEAELKDLNDNIYLLNSKLLNKRGIRKTLNTIKKIWLSLDEKNKKMRTIVFANDFDELKWKVSRLNFDLANCYTGKYGIKYLDLDLNPIEIEWFFRVLPMLSFTKFIIL